MSQISKPKLAILLFLLSGTISTLVYKMQSSLFVEEGPDKNKKFFHPYIQALTMFIGQSLCLIVYLIMFKKSQKNREQGKQQLKSYVLIVPALADSCSTILQYISLSFIAGSSYMMFKGSGIITTAIFSKILINMQIQKRHVAGCSMAFAGLMIVGSSGFIEQNSQGQSTFSIQLLGYILMLISLFFNGFYYAYQQRLLKKYQINPLQMVGFQGVFGICIMYTVVASLTFIQCPFDDSKCVYDLNNYKYMERIDTYFIEVGQDWLLILLVILGIITISVYNLNGVRITKSIDALARSLLNITKTSIIWIVGIIITIIGNGNQEMKFESLNVWVNLIKAVGFIIILIGTLVYNKIIFKKYFVKLNQEQQNEKIIQQNKKKLIDNDINERNTTQLRFMKQQQKQ